MNYVNFNYKYVDFKQFIQINKKIYLSVIIYILYFFFYFNIRFMLPQDNHFRSTNEFKMT